MKTYKGIHYWPTFQEARAWAAGNVRGFPAWRVVEYTRGWAVQLTISGPYADAERFPVREERGE